MSRPRTQIRTGEYHHVGAVLKIDATDDGICLEVRDRVKGVTWGWNFTSNGVFSHISSEHGSLDEAMGLAGPSAPSTPAEDEFWAIAEESPRIHCVLRNVGGAVWSAAVEYIVDTWDAAKVFRGSGTTREAACAEAVRAYRSRQQ